MINSSCTYIQVLTLVLMIVVWLLMGFQPSPHQDQSAPATPDALLFPEHAKPTLVHGLLHQMECYPRDINMAGSLTTLSPLLDEALSATESENTPVTFQLPPGFTLTQHHLTLHLYCLHVLQGTEDSALFPVYPQ